MKKGYTYIMINRPHGTPYIGMTDDLKRRAAEHKCGTYDGFTKKYRLTKLVYFEIHKNTFTAMNRERQMKKYLRHQKIALIEKFNPEWIDLYETIPE